MSAADSQSSIEVSARAAADRADYRAATRALIEGYGKEILGFLAALLRGNVGFAEDVFSEFSEDVWKGLPKFEWRCSARAWCYRLARNAASRQARLPRNRPERALPLSSVPDLEDIVDKARSATQPYLVTEIKDRFQKLREQLPAADQALLILRVDRNLSWFDVAHALSDTGGDSEQMQKAEVALRQRFVEVKRRLRELANEAGLL